MESKKLNIERKKKKEKESRAEEMIAKRVTCKCTEGEWMLHKKYWIEDTS